MKHAPNTHFSRAPDDAQPLTLRTAIAQAKTIVADMTDQTPDAIARCQRGDDGAWTIVIDTIESHARMGDNDLLAAYEICLTAEGELTQFERLRRYHREDQIG